MKLELPKAHKQLFMWVTFIAFAVFLDGACIFHLTSRTGSFAKTMTVIFLIIGGLMAAMLWLMYRNTDKPMKLPPVGFGAAAALWSFSMGEICMGSFVIKGSPIHTLMGYALYAVPYLLGAVIFKKPKIWFCVFEVLFAVYAAAQSYIISFREAPIKLSDISNIRSAIEIEGEYSLVPTLAVVVIVIQLAVMLFLTIHTELVTESPRPRLITLGAVAAASLTFCLSARFVYDKGVNDRTIRLNFSGSEDLDTSRTVGDLLMFCFDGLFNRVTVPEGYSVDKARALIEAYQEPEISGEHHPVIIAVLCESFADYSRIAPLETNKDYMPVIHSLKENTVKGYVTVSPYGGYTGNSEYEFLTGNSMYYLPLGSAPFTNYLDKPTDSLVSDLNRLGFETVSYTPCSRELWDIGSAYEYLGFKTKYFGSDLDLPYELTYNDQISDSALYEGLCRLVDARDKTRGAFYWVTTMQNHAPYDVPVEGGVELTKPADVNAERFLNCIYQSDKALGELIDHFKDYDEQVVILLFGDHYPHIEGFAETLYGRSVAGLGAEDYSRLHQTPYIIWSNRSIEAGENDTVSLNYLASDVLKAAGLPLSAARQELEHIRESLPIISSFGFMTGDGSWHQRGDEVLGYDSILNEYSTLQYYRMFDEEK